MYDDVSTVHLFLCHQILKAWGQRSIVTLLSQHKVFCVVMPLLLL